jgi:hypothetical protein
MKFLLDTDHISILQKQSGPEYVALMARVAQVRQNRQMGQSFSPLN